MACRYLCCCHSSKKSLLSFVPKEWISVKFKFRQASNRCRKVLKSAKLAYANWTREILPPRNLVFATFGEFKIGFSTKVGVKNSCKNCNLNDSCSSLSISFAELNQPQVHNVKATLKMTSKITKTLHSTNTSSHYCILEMVLKICEPEQASAHEACDSTLMLAKDNTTLNFTVYST